MRVEINVVIGVWGYVIKLDLIGDSKLIRGQGLFSRINNQKGVWYSVTFIDEYGLLMGIMIIKIIN